MKKNDIPDILYEKMLLNEIDDDERKILEKDKDLDKRLAELKKSNEQILKEYPPDETVNSIMEKYQAQKSKMTNIYRFTALPVAACLVVLLAVGIYLQIFKLGFASNGLTNPSIRLKGLKPTLFIYQKKDDGVELLKNGSSVRENDSLQLSYVSAGKKYGCIFSLDGNHVITLHYPEKHGNSLELAEKGEVLLDYSYKLDGAPFFERFFFITSDNKFYTQFLVEKLKTQTENPGKDEVIDLELSEEFDIFSILLKKSSE